VVVCIAAYTGVRVRLLNNILDCSSKIAIMRVLMEGPPKTGRQVAREVGITARASHLSLQALVRAGVATMEAKGGAHFFALVKDHPLIKSCVLPMLRAEKELVEGFKAALSTIFGDSVAVSVVVASWPGGSGGCEGVIRVIAVEGAARSAEYWQPYVESLRRAARRFCGASVSFEHCNIEEFRRKPPLPAGAFVVYGLEVDDVITGDRRHPSVRSAQVLDFFGVQPATREAQENGRQNPRCGR